MAESRTDSRNARSLVRKCSSGGLLLNCTSCVLFHVSCCIEEFNNAVTDVAHTVPGRGDDGRSKAVRHPERIPELWFVNILTRPFSTDQTRQPIRDDQRYLRGPDRYFCRPLLETCAAIATGLSALFEAGTGQPAVKENRGKWYYAEAKPFPH